MERTIAFVADGVVHVREPGGAPRRLESPFALEVRGRAQEIHRRHAAVAAPRAWQLLRRRPDGATEPVAESVLSYDVADDGAVVYSDGRSLRVVQPDGARFTLLSQPRVQQVVFVRG